MKISKLIFAGMFALAIAASFAFKANSHQRDGFVQTCSGWDNIEKHACDGLLTTTNDCSEVGAGAQCSAFINPSEGYTPAYVYTTPSCTYPLYHEY